GDLSTLANGFLAWPAAGAEGAFEAEALGGAEGPGGLAEGAGAGDAGLDELLFGFGLGGVDPAEVIAARGVDGPGREERLLLGGAVEAAGGAGEWPGGRRVG